MSISDKIKEKLYRGDNKLLLLDQRYLPRWIVVLIDLFLLFISQLVVYAIIENSQVNFKTEISLQAQSIIVLVVNLMWFVILKTYAGIIRHSTFTDVFKLASSSFATAASVLILSMLYNALAGDKVFITTSILLYMFISFTILLLFRLTVKESYMFLKNAAAGSFKKRVAILGIDDYTISLARALSTEKESTFKLIGFLTKHYNSKNLKIMGKPVIPVLDSITESIKDYNIEGILLTGDYLKGVEKNEVIEECLANGLEIFNVPNLEKWNKKEDIKQQIKPIQIEDLLERSQIKIDNDLIRRDIENRTILVTGGAGSIGSEIVRQISDFKPKLLVILDQAESALHELELFLRQNHPSLEFITELANISNMYRLEMLFNKYDFEIVYHAAAYKHVPLIERNPHEAIYVNVLGTVNLSVLAASHSVDKFVMISTDKAVNPTNVMGASKRAAEMYVQSLQHSTQNLGTRFITTRFGNVLGSNGSVIPHFRKQISQGGPVTVTHKDIIRYFMTIPEACQLVLQAGTMGNGGEIYVFDMGKPVKILDLAKKMIQLSGLEPYEDIDIKITGLRPGEKLFEELLGDTSTSLPTHHPKIMISKDPIGEFDLIKIKVKEIIKYATRYNDHNVVRLLKELVPEYKSENSKFEKLDSPSKN